MTRRAANSFGRFTTKAVAVAERVLGRKLPAGAVVHHTSGDHTDDSPGNLMVFPSKAYHNLIHARMDSMAACGHADWCKCQYCGVYDEPQNLTIRTDGGRRSWHNACRASYELNRYYARKNGRQAKD